MNFLDYASTCPVVKYPQRLYRDVLGEGYFFNPNANYAYKEKRLLSEAENRAKKAIGAKGGKVVFGGTSSQLIENLVATIHFHMDDDLWYDYQFFYSRYEHDSINRFSEGDYFYVDNLESIIEKTKEYHRDNIIPFVFWQGVSNITGEIFPVENIGKVCIGHKVFYICDATALVGHAPIPKNIDDWCSAFVIDGHKLGTELSIGCVWISDELDKLLDGFKLHGTPNLAGALAMTQAVEDACDVKHLSVSTNRYNNLYDNLFYILKKHSIDFQVIDGSIKTCAINAIRLPGFNADALQQYLTSKQIYVSIGGSACAEKHDYRVLNAYGLSNDEASEVIRVSFGEDSSVEDVKALVEGIKEFRDTYVK